ncbi:acyltransferase 3 [Novosphingobium nitrogenifigens DSM 19370]|uniref:Acyltransferase 3 n=1 Tax=Novosphingobium nitrogenifigens DSM 19370 TaxID=983920 RepID=F1ZDV3_9SPHN|nr:acyltransferase [Novosphingobium nitrogenifigens]EGD57210.1 acyltransferase 3 [Novosphingobium nitrogenifigens DSM 19370]
MPQEQVLNRNLAALTGVRFLAASAVLMFHFGAGFAHRIHAPEVMVHILTNGYLGVPLFFVLSGFIITYSHFDEAFTTGRTAHFMLARVARIYPVYLLSLLLMLPVLATPLSPIDAVSVLTMTQAWTPPASGHGYTWVMQAWTLSIEAVFYLLFPLVWPLLRRLPIAAIHGLALLSMVIIVVFGTPSISPGVKMVPLLGADTRVWIPILRMPEFALGMTLCAIFVRCDRTRAILRGTAVEIVLALAILIVMAKADTMQTKALFAPLAGLLLFALANGEGALTRLLATRPMILLGGASYALYILQGPVRALCAAIIHPPLDQFASPIVTLGAAILAFLFVEQPARRAILAPFRKRRP